MQHTAVWYNNMAVFWRFKKICASTLCASNWQNQGLATCWHLSKSDICFTCSFHERNICVVCLQCKSALTVAEATEKIILVRGIVTIVWILQESTEKQWKPFSAFRQSIGHRTPPNGDNLDHQIRTIWKSIKRQMAEGGQNGKCLSVCNQNLDRTKNQTNLIVVCASYKHKGNSELYVKVMLHFLFIYWYSMYIVMTGFMILICAKHRRLREKSMRSWSTMNHMGMVQI